MKKFYFSLIIAAMAAVSMNAEPVQQDIPLTIENWGWGWSSTVANVDNKLEGTVTAAYGAISTGGDSVIDLTLWDKLVVIVDNITEAEPVYWYLKLDLRDEAFVDEKTTPNNHMTFELAKSHDPATTNYLVIDFMTQAIPEGFKRDKVRVLAIQSEKASSFVVSRVFLEKAGATAIDNVSVRNNGIRYNLLGQPVGEDYKGVVILNGKKMIVR